MDVQMKRGILDGLVLATVSREDTYGYELTERINQSVDVAEMTLYPVLRRLEAQGLLSTYSEAYSGRLRKYYRITPEGRRRLEEIKDELRELRQVIDTIIRNDPTMEEGRA